MSKFLASPISIEFQLEDKQETVNVLHNQNLEIDLLNFTEGRVCAICYGDHKMLIPTGTSLIAKRSSQDSSVSSIFYSGKEIISANCSPLPIKLKKISFEDSDYQSEKFECSSSTTFALLIRDENCNPPKFISFYEDLSTWKNEIRKKLKPDTDLAFIDTLTRAQVKVFLGPEELKNGTHDSIFADNEDFSHLCFVSNSDFVEGSQILQVTNESFKVIPISTISKFILRKSSPSKQMDDKNSPKIVVEPFKADFNQLKLNSVDCIRAHASVYSYLYTHYRKFFAPIAWLCQCSGSGKSKSATTVLKETPGFYVCVREPRAAALAVPKSNSVTAALLEIFDTRKYIADSVYSQNDLLCKESTLGKCLMFVAQSIKSYIVVVAKNLASKLDGTEDEETLNKKLLSSIKDYSSENFESYNKKFELLTGDSMQNDFLKADGASDQGAKVSHVVSYIHKILYDSKNCFKFSNEHDNRLLETNANLATACRVISTKITHEKPFLFFIDEAGLLSKMNNYRIKESHEKYSAFQIFRRALSYLDLQTNIFFFALGTKSTIEEPPTLVTDSSARGLPRNEFFPPIVITQDFDIWREKYPLNEMVPCYKTLLNCCTFKFLATLGHPMFSGLNFSDIVKSTLEKLYNDSGPGDKTYLLAIWMIRAGLSCNPKSLLAESLVENHMATLLNIRPHKNSSNRQNLRSVPTFGNVGSASYDITYQSTPCLALAARKASLSLCLENKVEFFRKLEDDLESMAVDRGKLGEAIGSLLTTLLIDQLPNCAQRNITSEMIEEMKALNPKKFHSLWEAKGSLLCPNLSISTNDYFREYKVVKVESFLETLMGADNFERVKETFPLATLDGLMNASHFVSISRLGESLKNEAQSLANANDFVSDKHRNVITMDRLRLALARQCGLIMPPNYYGIDAIIPVCLATEEVIDPKGNVTIKDVGREGRENDIPYDLYDPKNANESKKNRYRPIYSFLAIQYKSGRFDLDAIPKMQARLHIVPCANFSKKNGEGIHIKCPNCVSELALKEIFDNQISLLYCFLDDSSFCLTKEYTVNYGPEIGNSDPFPSKLLDKEDFCKILYPNIRVQNQSNAKLVESSSVRTFEDFYLRHRIKLSENIELINIYCDENQGCTYRASDVLKFEIDEHKRVSLKFQVKKREIDADKDTDAAPAKNINNTSTASASSIQTKFPDPIRHSEPFNQSRMNTVIIYGWKPWEKVIGPEGTVLANKLFREFVQDPLKNVKAKDLKLLLPSLKIIMSSKLLGLDRYLESQDGQDDISYNDWLYFLFENFRGVSAPDYSEIYQSSRRNREE